jgi:hypothetical protein
MLPDHTGVVLLLVRYSWETHHDRLQIPLAARQRSRLFENKFRQQNQG